MSDDLREPWARRDEVWNRAARTAEHDAAAKADSTVTVHPEYVALVIEQHREISALMSAHTHERIRLALALRNEIEPETHSEH